MADLWMLSTKEVVSSWRGGSILFPHFHEGCSKSNLWLVLFNKKYWAGYSGQPVASVDVWCQRPPTIVCVFIELRPLWGPRNCVLSAIHQEQISSITEVILSVAALSVNVLVTDFLKGVIWQLQSSQGIASKVSLIDCFVPLIQWASVR